MRVVVPTDVGLFIYLQKCHRVSDYIVCLFNRHKGDIKAYFSTSGV